MRRMFSEKQIERIAKYVVQHDLSDVDLNVASINANGGVVAKTLYQNTATWDGNLTVRTQSGVTITPDYMKAIFVENKLNIVAIFKMEYTQDITNQPKLYIDFDDLTDFLADKIVDAKGIKLSENGTSRMHIASVISAQIRTENQLTDISLSYTSKTASLSRKDGYAKKMSIEIREGFPNGSAGNVYYYECRAELLII